MCMLSVDVNLRINIRIEMIILVNVVFDVVGEMRFLNQGSVVITRFIHMD